jgi:hypothetical protein
VSSEGEVAPHIDEGDEVQQSMLFFGCPPQLAPFATDRDRVPVTEVRPGGQNVLLWNRKVRKSNDTDIGISQHTEMKVCHTCGEMPLGITAADFEP